MFLSYQTSVFIANSDPAVFEIVDNSYVLYIKEAGNYWLRFDCTSNSGAGTLINLYRSNTAFNTAYSLLSTLSYMSSFGVGRGSNMIFNVPSQSWLMIALNSS
jgi:hypothetical protein